MGKGVGEAKQLRASGFDFVEYIRDVTNQLDIILVVGQLAINSCFWIMDEKHDLFFKYSAWFPDDNLTVLDPTVHEDTPSAAGAGRMLKSAKSSSNTMTLSADWETVGGLQVMQAVA